MHNTDYTDEVVYSELRDRLRGYPGVRAVTPVEFRHWASLVRPNSRAVSEQGFLGWTHQQRMRSM